MPYPSNLPSITEQLSPAFVYQVGWHGEEDRPITADQVLTQPVQPGDPVATIELINGNWRLIANPDNFVDLGGSGGGRFAGRTTSVTRFCSQVWISTQVGDLWHSSDGGRTFEKNIENLTSDGVIFTSYDSAGRLWRLDQVGTQPVAVYRSNSGKGDDWEQLFIISDGFISSGGSFPSGRGIATHPKNKDIFAFAVTEFGTLTLPYAYITQDSGSSWSKIGLPQNDFIESPPEPWGIYDIIFTESGRLIILFENFESEEPFENYYFADYSDDYESFQAVELLPEVRTGHAGFVGHLATIGNEVFAVFTRDHDPAFSPTGFDGLITHVAKSVDNGSSYQELTRFTQPTNDLIDMPGYPMGLIYDSPNKLLYTFFSAFGFSENGLIHDPGLFIQVVDESGNKSIATSAIEATGIDIPFSLYISISPQRTTFGVTGGGVNRPKGLLHGGNLSNLPAPDALCGGL